MATDLLAKLVEHNNWANAQIIRACAGLADEALDEKPWAGQWSIREILIHLVQCQRGYVSLLTLPPEDRTEPSVPFDELEESARRSGEALLDVARGDPPEKRLRTLDGYTAEPWVVMVQAVNHANDHRRQITTTMRAVGLTPPRLDGWAFGDAAGALTPTLD